MQPRPEYIERFSVDRAGNLVRSVVPALGRGKPYEHKCRKESFEEVAHARIAFATSARSATPAC